MVLGNVKELLPSHLAQSAGGGKASSMASYLPWLQQVALPYADTHRTVMQVDMVLQRVKFLKPKTDNFMKLGPPPELLICLFGQMELNFNGDPFSLNIEIWLPRSFPFQAPLVFILPTATQSLRPSGLVDAAGRVNHSYLAYWHTRPTSTLIEMMNYLHPAFCQDPPIFLEQKRAPSAPAPQFPVRAPAPQQLPVRPPEPQLSLVQMKDELKKKLISRYERLQSDLTTDTDRILAENAVLHKGSEKINKAISAIGDEIIAVQEETQQMSAKCASMNEMIEQLRSSGSLDVDKLVIPQGPISKQYHNRINIFLTCFRIIGELVKELAAQDCLYALSKAFEKGGIDLNVYLRLVREQAREEFMSKALILKIREIYPQ